ncbi:MAG TPA: hypothetical protein VD735_06900 [Candidatus Saccharimonadales bacterium]|nr:hypothetical protein [Candidatus Saccharimonadales bacterium]
MADPSGERLHMLANGIHTELQQHYAELSPYANHIQLQTDAAFGSVLRKLGPMQLEYPERSPAVGESDPFIYDIEVNRPNSGHDRLRITPDGDTYAVDAYSAARLSDKDVMLMQEEGDRVINALARVSDDVFRPGSPAGRQPITNLTEQGAGFTWSEIHGAEANAFHSLSVTALASMGIAFHEVDTPINVVPVQRQEQDGLVALHLMPPSKPDLRLPGREVLSFAALESGLLVYGMAIYVGEQLANLSYTFSGPGSTRIFMNRNKRDSLRGALGNQLEPSNVMVRQV